MASVPAATAAGTFGLGPTQWRTIGTGWRMSSICEEKNVFADCK